SDNGTCSGVDALSFFLVSPELTSKGPGTGFCATRQVRTLSRNVEVLADEVFDLPKTSDRRQAQFKPLESLEKQDGERKV
ncbi:hypothetical protein NDU88_004116, partial [Pleurodeles waltl]